MLPSQLTEVCGLYLCGPDGARRDNASAALAITLSEDAFHVHLSVCCAKRKNCGFALKQRVAQCQLPISKTYLGRRHKSLLQQRKAGFVVKQRVALVSCRRYVV